MTDYFFAPHSDDEAMFGAYTLLRHKPTVVQTLRCDLRKHTTWQIREQEARAGAAVLGCDTVVQWDVLESAPDKTRLIELMRALPNPETVWVPMPYDGGHPHHNLVGFCAIAVFGAAATLYATYALNSATGENEKQAGQPVPFEQGWPELKRAALDCYRSQHHNSSFQWPLEEYLA